MRTNKIIAGICLCFALTNVYAENIDSVKIVTLERELKEEISTRKLLNKEILKLENLINKQSHTIKSQGKCIDSLSVRVLDNQNKILSTAESLGFKIEETSTNLNSSITTKADAVDLHNKSIWGILLIVFLFLMGGFVYFMLHRRINKGNENVDLLRRKAEKINEDILNQFSLDMVEMQKISSSLSTLQKATESNSTKDDKGEPDHSLIKTLADRITFMDMTLYKMDPKVRGYKQLSRSIAQMKDNLLANGYELVEMMGKPYNDGMKVIANFIEDEDLEEGKQIITGITKPQINYKGIMIQAAQITVSQNI